MPLQDRGSAPRGPSDLASTHPETWGPAATAGEARLPAGVASSLDPDFQVSLLCAQQGPFLSHKGLDFRLRRVTSKGKEAFCERPASGADLFDYLGMLCGFVFGFVFSLF